MLPLRISIVLLFAVVGSAHAAKPVLIDPLSPAYEGGSGSVGAPDVAKTPSPAGPVPIPYPNTGKSEETKKKGGASMGSEIKTKPGGASKLGPSSPPAAVGTSTPMLQPAPGSTPVRRPSGDVKLQTQPVSPRMPLQRQSSPSAAPSGVQLAPSQTPVRVSP